VNLYWLKHNLQGATYEELPFMVLLIVAIQLLSVAAEQPSLEAVHNHGFSARLVCCAAVARRRLGALDASGFRCNFHFLMHLCTFV
jgi:hypothetical protein